MGSGNAPRYAYIIWNDKCLKNIQELKQKYLYFFMSLVFSCFIIFYLQMYYLQHANPT